MHGLKMYGKTLVMRDKSEFLIAEFVNKAKSMIETLAWEFGDN